MVGVGIRSAQEMVLRRKGLAPVRTPVEDELWKRAFWLLVSMDLFMSAFVGLPRATTPDEYVSPTLSSLSNANLSLLDRRFDCELPCECDDEYWENPDPEQAFVQPKGKPSLLSFFVCFLRLLDIVSFAQQTLVRGVPLRALAFTNSQCGHGSIRSVQNPSCGLRWVSLVSNGKRKR